MVGRCHVVRASGLAIGRVCFAMSILDTKVETCKSFGPSRLAAVEFFLRHKEFDTVVVSPDRNRLCALEIVSSLFEDSYNSQHCRAWDIYFRHRSFSGSKRLLGASVHQFWCVATVGTVYSQ